MAENQEDRSTEDLSEEASPHRVEEYRRRGIVPQSRELSGLFALLAAGIATYIVSPQIGATIAEFMKEVFRTDLSARLNLGSNEVLAKFLGRSLSMVVMLSLPVALASFVVGALGSFMQVGSVFSTEPITPDFSKVDPLQGLKRFLSIRQFTEGARITIKMTILASIAYGMVKSEVLNSPILIAMGPEAVMQKYGEIGKVIFLSLVMVLAIFAGIDYGFQRWEFSKKVRMTKEEARQEYKEREGDPQIKARVRAVQREVSRRRMMQAVKKADVVITNPTHIAVAIVYDKDSMAAPKVVAKGADFVAQKIKAIALEAGVPMVENVPLARTLFKTVKVGKSIPRALYQAVAEVLAYVYRLKKGRF